MIAVDSNVLVYALHREAPQHRRAEVLLTELAESDRPWALAWPSVYEFLRVVTHRRVFSRPASLEDALSFIEDLLDAPSLSMLGETTSHRGHLRRMLLGGQATGNLVHDAHIAALLAEHGVTEWWTADRDFSRFPGIQVRNPFDADR